MPSRPSLLPRSALDPLDTRLRTALSRRETLLASRDTTAWRVLDGAGDGVPGVYVDRLGPVAILSVYDDARLSHEAITAAARATLQVLGEALGVVSVYVKPFARDRSRLGGDLPDEARSPTPRAGAPQPETLVVQEHGVRFEVRPYDGLSTGLFLEHREHRRALAVWRPARALNLFAYTCGFAVPLALAGVQVTNVDVSARYLDWGRRNAALNGIDPASMRFFRRDALEFLAQAARKPDERFDLVILDPPSFGAADRRRGVSAWRAVDDYPALVRAAAQVVTPGGRLFAATNTRELAQDDALAALVDGALARPPRWQTLPPWPDDVREPGRVAAVCVVP